MDLGSLVRRLVPGAGSSPSGDRSATGGAGASGGVASPPVPITAGEWRSLPPIQRTVGDAPLVAPSAPFKAGLAAAGPAPIALAPLGHERHLAAPAGLATGIAAPVQRAPAEPIPTSVRRRGGAGRGAAIAATGVSRRPDADTEEPPAEAPVPGWVGESPASVTVTPRPVEGPSLVSAPSAPRPTGLVGTAAVARSFSVAQRSAQGPDSASRGSPVGLPIGPVPSVAAEASPGLSEGITAPIAGSGPPLVARRLRLGPPVRSPASAGPVTAHPAGSSAAPGRPTVARAVAGTPSVSPEGASAAAGAPAAPGEAAAAPATPSPGVPPVHKAEFAGTAAVRPSVAVSTLPVATETTATAMLSPVVLRAVGPARRPSLPLVGGLRPSVNLGSPAAVPRPAAPEPVAGLGGEPGSPSAALAALARVDPFRGPLSGPSDGPGAGAPAPGGAAWSAPFAGRPAGFGPGSATHASAGTGISVTPAVSRSIDQEDDAPADAEPHLTWTNPWLPAGASATDRATSPVPAGSGSSPQASDGGRRVARPIVSRAPGGPFVPRPRGLRVAPAIQRRSSETGSQSVNAAIEPAHALEPLAGWGTDGDAPPVSRLSDAASPPVALAPVQRAEDAAPADPAAGVPGGAAGAPGSPTAEKELDDLARRLYDRIGLRLRRDLLVERERAGALVDRGF